MDPRRKKIYIILIITCFVLSAGILGWSFLSTPTVRTPNVSFRTPNSVSPTEASGSATEGFRAPSVFPVTQEFHSAILESPAFRKLHPYSGVSVEGELGRPDPFRSY